MPKTKAELEAEAGGLEPPSTTAGDDSLGMPLRQLPTDAAGNPKPTAQGNHRCVEGFAYTDPDSRILKGSDSWIQGFNCQAAVDVGTR